jgi:hypothetical protein
VGRVRGTRVRVGRNVMVGQSRRRAERRGRRARTGVRWGVYDHWRDDPDSFGIDLYWLLTS